jgi:hypothetical protein
LLHIVQCSIMAAGRWSDLAVLWYGLRLRVILSVPLHRDVKSIRRFIV